MRFVERDGAGNIVAIYAVAHEGATEVIAPEDPELLGFVTEGSTEDAMRTYLATSDSDLLRILEDLINVLIDNNVMLLTDFPPPRTEQTHAPPGGALEIADVLIRSIPPTSRRRPRSRFVVGKGLDRNGVVLSKTPRRRHLSGWKQAS